MAAHGSDSALVDELACFGGAIGARLEFFPLNLHSGGVDDALCGCRYFRADAFAGDQGDFVSHGCIVLYAKPITLSKYGNGGVGRKNPAVLGPNQGARVKRE